MAGLFAHGVGAHVGTAYLVNNVGFYERRTRGQGTETYLGSWDFPCAAGTGGHSLHDAGGDSAVGISTPAHVLRLGNDAEKNRNVSSEVALKIAAALWMYANCLLRICRVGAEE